ncbi:hypothetical protein [Clostridium cylindrosporum]|uniref:Niacin transporter NiaX n=1 Tax=Clostridium cylindrosporum DSM 605 TaxID=1121307 RepID=A0A0J8D892_CLOCY|nr:hypothetical protein [Clostridium cylindrosporum]KMT22082.1 hypothetical protein CLCY_4c00550 [Clostridium cylindrosporum DSM 605]
MKIKKMVLTGLLMSLAIVIPVMFGGFLRITIPPFSATLASHVPIFLSMFLGPLAAAVVAIGSAIGFLITSPAVIAARAFMHLGVSVIGSYMLKSGKSYWTTMIVIAPIHGLLECLVVVPFGFDLYKAFIVVGIGTILHHFVDAVITKAILPLMKIASPAFEEEMKDNTKIA